MSKRKQIGVFAGTFDPIHAGHLAFADLALGLGLEKVIFLPEPRPRRKQGVHSLEHRLAMVKLAIAHNNAFSVIDLQQPKFTPLDTLPILQARFDGYEIVLLFGDDVIKNMVDHIADWPHLDDLANTVRLIIATRQDNRRDIKEGLNLLDNEYGLRFRYMFVDPYKKNTSSSQIRRALKASLPVEGLPEGVLRYIRAHSLYTNTSNNS